MLHIFLRKNRLISKLGSSKNSESTPVFRYQTFFLRKTDIFPFFILSLTVFSNCIILLFYKVRKLSSRNKKWSKTKFSRINSWKGIESSFHLFSKELKTNETFLLILETKSLFSVSAGIFGIDFRTSEPTFKGYRKYQRLGQNNGSIQ